MTNLVELTKDLVEKSPQLDVDGFWFTSLMGKIIFAHRIKAGLTQSELAKSAGVVPKDIHRIEGGSEVSTRVLEKTLDALNITPKELAESIQ